MNIPENTICFTENKPRGTIEIAIKKSVLNLRGKLSTINKNILGIGTIVVVRTNYHCQTVSMLILIMHVDAI